MSENKKIDKSVLLFSKRGKWCWKVYEYLRENFTHVRRMLGDWGDTFRIKEIREYYAKEYDYVISYLCPWILPKEVLDLAKEHAINFHPAPPKYPGIGGYNYAIWNGDEEYGVMVHKMDEKVDSGYIYDVSKFLINDNETVMTLKEKSMETLFALFVDVIDCIKEGKSFNFNGFRQGQEKFFEWHTPPYTRKDFQKNCEIRVHEYDRDYIEKCVRAFYFPGARDYPFFKINGKKYKVTPVDE